MSHPPGFSRWDPTFFSLSISTLYVCVLRLKLFSRVLDVILLCLRSLWSVGVAEPHWCVLSLCVHAFVSKQRKREKFVAAVETEGDNYDNPVRCPVAFLCINFCMIRGGLFSAQSFPGNVCGMMWASGEYSRQYFFRSADCFTSRITGSMGAGFAL